MFKRNVLSPHNMENRSLPAGLSIEPTYRCNLNCSMCFYDKKAGLGRKELLVADFINFLDKRKRIAGVVIPGREPMIKENFFELIFYLQKRYIPFVLETNGLLINKSNYERLLGGNKRNIIYLSIDGDERVHNMIRGSSAAFSGAIAAARLLAGKIDLRVVCTISEKNIRHLWKLPRIIKAIGHEKIIFEYERRYTKKSIADSKRLVGQEGFDLLKISAKIRPGYSFSELNENIEKAEAEAKRCGVKVEYLPQYFKEKMADIYFRRLRRKNRLFCKYLNNIRIDPEGNIIHCFAYRRPFGNIKEATLEEIWNSKPYRDFRRKLIAENLMPICETCWGAIPDDYNRKPKT